MATDINTDPGCGRTMDPDMVIGSSLGREVSMVPSGSTGHPDQHQYLYFCAWLIHKIKRLYIPKETTNIETVDRIR